MYMSLYFYGEGRVSFSPWQVINIMDMFSELSHVNYNRINLFEFNEYGEPVCNRNYYKKESFLRDSFVRDFVSNMSEYASINASVGKPEDEDSSPFYITFLQASDNGFPSRICVLMKVNSYENTFFAGEMSTILLTLQENHFVTNNSFWEVHPLRKMFFALDGCSSSAFFELLAKSYIDKAILHFEKYKDRNHIMDVFCCNSIKADILTDKQKSDITAVCGEDNVLYAANNYIFSVAGSEKTSFSYRIRAWKKICKIRKIIQ